MKVHEPTKLVQAEVKETTWDDIKVLSIRLKRSTGQVIDFLNESYKVPKSYKKEKPDGK